MVSYKKQGSEKGKAENSAKEKSLSPEEIHSTPDASERKERSRAKKKE